MESTEYVLELIKEVFSKLEKAETIVQVENIIKEHELVKYQMDADTYPEIRFSITKKDIEQLKSEKSD